MADYTNLSLKKELLDEVDKFIEEYPELGYRSLAQFVEDAVRRRKKELRVSELLPRYKHENTHNDHITITDKKYPNTEIDIYPQEDGTLWCEHDDNTDCNHVRFILDQRKIMEQLEKKGWKPKY